MQIHLLPGLSLNQDGRLVNDNNDWVHLRQGDMDGACGPYCVVMSLLARKTAKREEFIPLNGIDYRTRAGKLLKELRTSDPMVLSGMDIKKLQELFTAHNTASSEVEVGSSKQLLSSATNAIKDGLPVILGIKSRKSDELDHWTLAIGASNECLYLLDPAYDLPVGNYWNAVLSVAPTSNRFGYRYMNAWNCCEVEADSILVVN